MPSIVILSHYELTSSLVFSDTHKMNLLWILWLPSGMVIFSLFLQYYWKKRRLNKHSSKVRGPKGWPFIGCALEFTGSCDDIYDTFMRLFTAYPDIGKLWFGSTLGYLVTKPEYLQTILSSSKALSKMYLYKYAVPTMGHGLFSAPVSTWKRHRKIIMPAFNPRILDGFVEIFANQSNIMCKRLKQFIGGQEFDLFHVLSRCSLDILCETAMGVKVNTQTEKSAYGQWVDRLMEIIFLRIAVFWYQFDFIFKWTKLYQDEKDLTEKFNSFNRKIVTEKIKNINQNTSKSASKRKAFLDLLIELSTDQNKLTDDEIKDEVNTFMMAGSDTTAASICFIFTMLGMHHDIQNRVYEEIIEILGPDRTVEPQDLSLLKYTERVIKETLRLFPIGPFIMRDIDDDLPLEDDLILPKGSSVALGIMPVHRRADYWPDPLKFDPDRFLPEEIAKRHPFSFIPFSGGLRNCIGPKYAMMAMKSIVATVLRNYKFHTNYESVGDIKLKAHLVLRPRDGFKVWLELRN